MAVWRDKGGGIMGIDDTKRGLREHFRAVRKELGTERRTELDAAIAARVMSLPEFAQANIVFSYLSFGVEVDTRVIIQEAWRRGKTVALPYCVSGARELRWFEVTAFEGFIRSRFGVEEPDPKTFPELDPASACNAIAIVPGLTFDLQGYRLGYGGGFYDTFLATFPGTSIGLCREPQLACDLAAKGAIAPHDLPVDIVATDRRMLNMR